MAALILVHFVVLQRFRGSPRQRWAFYGTWLLLAALFISPLCALSAALFAARVAHHVLLVGVVAPLVILSLPERWRSHTFSIGGATGIFAVHTLLLWIWHTPHLYDLAMTSHAVFWVMQLTLLGTALAMWLVVLSSRSPLVISLTALLGSVMQMGLLGAIITFARKPLYASHFGVTEPFGLSALQDQQVAGMIMWVPAVLPYLGAALILFGRLVAPRLPAGRAR